MRIRRLTPGLLLATAATLSCASNNGTRNPQTTPQTQGNATSDAGTSSSTNQATLAPGVLLEQDGNLSEEDLEVGGSFVDQYSVRVAANESLVITLTSAAFDPILDVRPPREQQLTNDDYEGDIHRSQLEVRTQNDGELKINVRSYTASGQGSYRIRVARAESGENHANSSNPHPQGQGPIGEQVNAAVLGASGDLARVHPNEERRHHAVPSSFTNAQPLQAGQSARGNLAGTDLHLTSGEFADVYQLQGTQGQTVALTLRSPSDEFDPYLIFVGPNGHRWDNDDSDGSHNSGLTIEIPETGTYYAIATTYRPGITGTYELKLLGAPRADAANAANTAAQRTPPTRGTNHKGFEGLPKQNGAQPTRGSLAQGDQQLRSGEFYDTFTYNWPAGARVHIEARSTAFDTYLIVRPPSGEPIQNDDMSQGSTNAGLDLQTTTAGRYTVLVTSYRPGEVGDYELVIGAGGATGTPPTQTNPPAQTPPTQPPPAGSGATRETRGDLRAGDQRLSSGEFVDTIQVPLAAGQQAQFRLSSTAFDTYLIVVPPSGEQQDNDDYAAGSTDAGIDIPSAEAGTYTVRITSFRPGMTGAYVLRTTIGGAGATGGTTVPTTHTGGATGGPVLWGIFAGISDYPGSENDLPECANDARKLRQALQQRGMISDDHTILLTDSQVTVAGVRGAMQQVAQRVGPNDVFVFFYSGHGGHTNSSTDTREIDGKDEYLYLYDGPLQDDEYGRLFDAVHARVGVLALDACFSGGFAKDAITRRGQVGLFSSEEDVTSGVASQFQAGGYLSHFLRVGMGGDADDDPRDNTLTVGEITHYVYRQFGTQANHVSMGRLGYQHLVIDRGAVGANELLFRYNN